MKRQTTSDLPYRSARGELLLKRDDWPLEDPKGKPRERVREIRDDVEQRVRQLLSTYDWLRTT